MDYVKSLTFLQIHLFLSELIDERLRENGVDPEEEVAEQIAQTPDEIRSFFSSTGR